jgi:membrane-associated phospholipid phosphatase
MQYPFPRRRSPAIASAPLSLPSAARWLAAAAFLLVVAGWLVHASGAGAAWMLGVHAHVPGDDAATAWSCVTVLGLGSVALVLLLAADRGRGELAVLLAPTFLLGGLLAHVPKALFAVPRPAATSIAAHLHIIGHAFTGPVSMPSGHALTAAGTVALLCVVVARSTPARVGLVLAGALVAWSRVVVGAHWPSDVFVGAGLGLFAAAAALGAAGSRRGAAWHRWLADRIATPAGQRWIAIVELAVAALLLSERTGYPAAQPIVWQVAGVAVVSAAYRWRASRRLRASGSSGHAPVKVL